MIVFHYLVYLVFRGVEFLISVTPLWLCWWIGGWSGWIAHFALPKYRRLVESNLRIAFGDEMGVGECRRICRRHFASLGRNFLCGLKVSLMRPSAVEKRVRYENRQAALDIIEEGTGAIAAILHMGPWEILTQIPSFGPGVAKAALYQPLGNPFVNRHILRTRAQEGVSLFDRRKGFYGPMNHLREGGGLGILVDQHAGDSGVWCPFFGRLASTTNLPALLALRTGVPIVPIGLYPDGVARWRIVYGEPIRITDREGRELGSGRITAELNLAVERIVRRAPEEWFWVHNRWKTPKPDFLLSAYRRGIEFPEGFGPEDLKPFRILVRSPNWLGDACMAVPTVRAVKGGRPDAEITVLCDENLAEMWRAVRHVDHVLARPKRAGVAKVAGLIRREGPFDAGILFPNSLRSALEMKLAGIGRIVGYRGHRRAWLVNQQVPERNASGPPEHHTRRYLRIAHAVGADKTDPELQAPRAHQPSFQGTWRIGLCPGAAYGGAKRWPTDRYARVVESLHRRLEGNVHWTMFGAPNEAPLAEALGRACSVALENAVGRTSLTDLMDRLEDLHVLVTNDTGTMHLAGLLGIKTVAIFGSTEPDLTAPLGPGHRVLRRHVACSPCFLRECPLDFRCMDGITAGEVETAVLAVLGETEGALTPTESPGTPATMRDVPAKPEP